MALFGKGISFDTQGEDGCAYSVVPWVEYIETHENGIQRRTWVPSGFESLRLEDGRHVRAIGEDRYAIGSSGIALQRISRTPSAHEESCPSCSIP